MSDELALWHAEAEARAERAVEPLLVTGSRIEQQHWHLSGTAAPELLAHVPIDGDVAYAPALRRRRAWRRWQLRHGSDLFLTFRTADGMVVPVLHGPFSPERLDAILHGRRVRTLGDVPERFVAADGTTVVARSGETPEPASFERAFRGWLTYCVTVVTLSTAAHVAFDDMHLSVGIALGLLGFAVVLALIYAVLRPDGPRDPSESSSP